MRRETALKAGPAEVAAAGSRAGGSTTESPDARIQVRRAARLRGTVQLPGDKSITHRALLLAALAEGRSLVLGGSDGLDCNSTAACLEQLGVQVERLAPAEGGRVDRAVISAGRDGLRRPVSVLDCGNSGTTLRLLTGILAGCPFEATLDGDASLRRRPVARIIEPLRSMGARLSARAGDTLPPLTVEGRFPLRGIAHTPAVPSAQVKSAILLAGLSADGPTAVHEPVETRDHTERMLEARGVAVTRTKGPAGSGSSISLEGPARVRAIDERVPGDISAAAFWLVAGAAHPDAEIVIEDVGVNPTRRAVIELLRRMGAQIDEQPVEDGSEPRARLTVRSSRLSAIDLGPAEVARTIDEIPVLCLAAACAEGTTVVAGAAELRHKESDRLAGIAAGLEALGAGVEMAADGLRITGRPGGAALRGAFLDSHDDHRLAMTFAVAGLIADGETVIDGAGSIPISDPGFLDTLAGLQA